MDELKALGQSQSLRKFTMDRFIMDELKVSIYYGFHVIDYETLLLF